ncbi:MAG TPA: U32 family peptidase, partial [Alkalispirochaeta sp.]|nr:U32 family peptidase [Alkalispirochaeta sp.]
MELLAPAGNLEKLATAYRYGADAAYIGVSGFSLRAHADTLGDDPAQTAARIREIKPPGGRLYAALNLFAHQEDLERLPEAIRVLRELPVDAVIL